MESALQTFSPKDIPAILNGEPVGFSLICSGRESDETARKAEAEQLWRWSVQGAATLQAMEGATIPESAWGETLDTLVYHHDEESEVSHVVKDIEDAVVFRVPTTMPDDGQDIPPENPDHPTYTTINGDPVSIMFYGLAWAIEKEVVLKDAGGGEPITSLRRWYMFTFPNGSGTWITGEIESDDELAVARAINARNLRLGLKFPWSRHGQMLADNSPQRYVRPDAPPMPEVIPLPTGQEARAICISLRDAPRLSNWKTSGDKFAPTLSHLRPSSDHTVIVKASDAVDAWGVKNDDVLGSLTSIHPDCELTARLIISRISREGPVRVVINDLINAHGYAPRTARERDAIALRLSHELRFIASMEVKGVRKSWRNPDTRQTETLYVNGPLVAFMGETGDQYTLDGSGPPKWIDLAPGTALIELLKRPKSMAYLGDVRAILAIPRGQAAGSWAVHLALKLHDFWRINANSSSSPLGLSGGYSTTREKLYGDMSRLPNFFDLLSSKNPGRAIEYDAQAWRLLADQGIIDTADGLPFGTLGANGKYAAPSRRGWQEDFKKCPLTLRPGPAILSEIQKVRAKPGAKALPQPQT